MPVSFSNYWRILRRILIALIALMLVVSAFLSLPSVQTWAAEKVARSITEKTGLDLDLQRLQYRFPNKLHLSGLLLRDEDADTVLHVGHLTTDLQHFDRRFSGMHFGRSVIDDLDIYLTWHHGDSLNGFQKFLQVVKRKEGAEKKPFFLDMDQIHIEHLRFELEHEDCPDCFEIHWPRAELDVHDLVVHPDTIGARMRHISFYDPDRLNLRHMEGQVHYAKHSSGFSNWLLMTDSSRIQGDVRLSYGDTKDYTSFIDQVELDIQLKDSRVSFHDGNVFLASIPDLPVLEIDLDAQGTLDSFLIHSLDLRHNAITQAQMSGSMQHLRAAQGPDIVLDITEWKSHSSEIRSVLDVFGRQDDWPQSLDSLGAFRLSGIFRGNALKMEFQGDLASEMGSLQTESQWRIDTTANARHELSGAFRFNGLRSDFLLPGQDLGAMDGGLVADVQLNAKGMPEGSVQAALKKLHWKGTDFSGIHVDGVFKEESFTGSLQVDDSLVQLKFFGSADLSIEDIAYDFRAEFKKIDLAGLGWVDDSIGTLAANVELRAKGLFPDSLNGSLNITEATYEDPMNFYFFKNMVLRSSWEDSIHRMEFRSDPLHAYAQGQFTVSQLGGFVRNYIQRYVGGDSSYAKGIRSIDCSVELIRPKIFNELLLPDWQIDPGARISAQYTDQEDILHLDIQSAAVSYLDYSLKGIRLRDRSRGNGLQLSVDELEAGGRSFSDLSLRTLKRMDSLTLELQGTLIDTTEARFQLAANLLRTADTTFKVHWLPSKLIYGAYQFNVPASGWLKVEPSQIEVHELEMQSDEGRLFADGFVSKSPLQVLRLSFEGFELGFLNPILDQYDTEVFARVSGQVIMSELLAKPKYGIGLRTEQTLINDFALGDLDLYSDWSLYTGVVNLSGQIEQEGVRKLDLTGQFVPDSLYSDMQLQLDRFDLNVLQPYMQGVITELRGACRGQLELEGKLGDLSVKGQVELPDAGFTLPVLNTDYQLQDIPTVRFSDRSIQMAKVPIRDTRLGSKGTVELYLAHDRLKNFDLDMQIEADKLLCLNTSSKDSPFYYGKAFGTGLIRLSGTPEALELDVDAKADEGTLFSIPMGGPKEVVGTSFISFHQTDRSLLEADPEEEIRLEESGNPLALHFDLEVTPEAELEIIIDEQTGDLLRGRGRGQLQIDIDREGDVQIVGDVAIDKGHYQFTLTGIVNRRFDLVEGGTLSWDGSPFDSQIDIKARYNTRVSLGPILDDYKGVRTDLDLYLILRENLMNPTIDFDIQTPQATSDAQAKLQNYFSNKDRLNRQAFSILSMNTLLAESGTNSGGGVFSETNLTNNTYQMLTNQVSNWLNSGVNFIDINVNYVGSEDPGVTNDEFEVGVSKKLMNDRLTINGEFDVPVGADQAQNQQQSLVGDVELVYDITPDGRFKARVFNQTNDQLNGQITTMYTQGLGVFYTTDFNDLGELVQKVFGIKPKSGSDTDEE